ncbi:MAG: hypothetical protein Q4C61_14260 [Lachnospiraceae bacterium]|nr:hypothetical protein [Lachnospiraceae bacterium]
MKRCVICGNVGDDNSTTCEVCGNPYMDLEENASDAAGAVSFHEQLTPEQDTKEESEMPAQPRTQKEVSVPETKAVQPQTEEVSKPEAKAVQPQTEEVSKSEAEAIQPQTEEVPVPEAEAVQPRTQHKAFASEAKTMQPQEEERVADAQNPQMKEKEKTTAVRTEKQPQMGSETRPVRRVRSSGPQIYGQNGSVPAGAEYSQQGMMRRNVQGRPAGAQQGMRPMQQQTGIPAQGQMNRQAQQRPVNPAGRQPDRPMSPVQGRPMNQMMGQPGRPMNTAQNLGARPAIQSPGAQPRKIMETARKMLKSPLFLLIAILNTVYLAGSIGAVFMNQMNYSQAARLIKSVALPAQVSGYTNTILSLLSKLDSGALVANLVLRIPDILFCVGLWLIFVMALSAKENMSGVGFGFVKATVIINMVVYCLVMLALLIVSVAVVIASWISGKMSVIIISAVVLVVVIVMTMLVIMFHFCYLATLKTCRLNGNTGEEYGSVSGYVAVVHILLALFSVINLLSGIVNSEIANIVSAVGGIGWMLLFAIWLFMYRGRMDDLEA